MSNEIQAGVTRVGHAGEAEPAASTRVSSDDEEAGPLGTLLPEPSMVVAGDIGAEVAMLGILAGRDEQQIDQTTEQEQDRVSDKAERAEVTEMHREARDIMSSAIAAGEMQVCQGATQMAGAGTPPGQSSELGGTATLLGAGATLFTAQGQSQQQLDQAKITSFKAIADRAQQSSTEATQGETDARSVIANAIQFCQEYEQTRSQIDLAAAGQKA